MTLLIAAALVSGCVAVNGEALSPPMLMRPMADASQCEGEYIITITPSVTLAEVLPTLHEYHPVVVKDLQRGRYLIALTPDPGQSLLEKHLMGIAQIQPNFIYHTQPSPSDGMGRLLKK